MVFNSQILQKTTADNSRRAFNHVYKRRIWVLGYSILLLLHKACKFMIQLEITVESQETHANRDPIQPLLT